MMETENNFSYGRRFRGREALALILLLLLVVWVYRNDGLGSLRRLIDRGPTATGGENPIENAPPPLLPPGVKVSVQSDVMGYTRVAAERLNLRSGPGVRYSVTATLLRGWRVAVLRQLHVTTSGEAWIEVMAETSRGWQYGWVSQRYLEPCDCPYF